MPPTNTFPLVDRLLGGGLEVELRRRRAVPESFETIARWLASTHALDISSATVRRWCIELGLEHDPVEPKSVAS